MKNFIEYFYNIKIDKINNYRNYYTFLYKEHKYKLYIYNNDYDIEFIYKLNKDMINVIPVHEIIININNQIISEYKNKKYILLKIYVNDFEFINLFKILDISNTFFTNNIEINWGMLWEKKIDYLENLIHENGKKYPLIVDSFNYFVGLAENAISYYENINIDKYYKKTISHRNINLLNNNDDIYNPFNIIFDYQVRDVAEYIKYSFFNDKVIDDELIYYFKNYKLSRIDASLLISRLLYPSYYFNLYEDILINGTNESILIKVISKINNYEIFLEKIINYLSNLYNIDNISWLKKNYKNL